MQVKPLVVGLIFGEATIPVSSSFILSRRRDFKGMTKDEWRNTYVFRHQ